MAGSARRLAGLGRRSIWTSFPQPVAPRRASLMQPVATVLVCRGDDVMTRSVRSALMQRLRAGAQAGGGDMVHARTNSAFTGKGMTMCRHSLAPAAQKRVRSA